VCLHCWLFMVIDSDSRGNKQKTVLAKQEAKQIGHAIEKLAAKQEAK
jgi:hypothetical protein